MKTVKTIVVGGLIFLVPFAVALLVFGKVYSVAMRLAEPLDGLIPIEAIGGVALANILAIAIILLACFLAGIVATRTWGKRLYLSDRCWSDSTTSHRSGSRWSEDPATWSPSICRARRIPGRAP